FEEYRERPIRVVQRIRRKLFQRPVAIDQLRRGLWTTTGNAGITVRRITHEREIIGNELRIHTKLRAHALRVANHSAAAIDLHDAIDRRSGVIRNAEGVRAKFGVDPQFIPDYLALVGDSADGYPGISGCGPKTAAQLINRYGPLEEFPPNALNDANRPLAILFKDLATLRSDEPLFKNVDVLEWRGT